MAHLKICSSKHLPCLLRPYYVNSLWASDVIWLHRSESTLAQAMACYLTAPIHCLTQCWLLISTILWHSPESNSIVNTQATMLLNEFSNYAFKTIATYPRGQSFNDLVVDTMRVNMWTAWALHHIMTCSHEDNMGWYSIFFNMLSAKCRPYCSGVGVTEAPFVNLSVSEIFLMAKMHVVFFESHSYFTGVTAAQLRCHLSNINVIFNS